MNIEHFNLFCAHWLGYKKGTGCTDQVLFDKHSNYVCKVSDWNPYWHFDQLLPVVTKIINSTENFGPIRSIGLSPVENVVVVMREYVEKAMAENEAAWINTIGYVPWLEDEPTKQNEFYVVGTIKDGEFINVVREAEEDPLYYAGMMLVLADYLSAQSVYTNGGGDWYVGDTYSEEPNTPEYRWIDYESDNATACEQALIIEEELIGRQGDALATATKFIEPLDMQLVNPIALHEYRIRRISRTLQVLCDRSVITHMNDAQREFEDLEKLCTAEYIHDMHNIPEDANNAEPTPDTYPGMAMDVQLLKEQISTLKEDIEVLTLYIQTELQGRYRSSYLIHPNRATGNLEP